jgi:hypothetical protein
MDYDTMKLDLRMLAIGALVVATLYVIVSLLLPTV